MAKGMAVSLAALARWSTSPLISRNLASRSSRVIFRSVRSRWSGTVISLRDARREKNGDDETEHEHDHVGQPRPVAGEVLAEEAMRLHVTQARQREEEQAQSDQDAAGDPVADEALEVLQRFNRLLARVRLHEVDGLGERLFGIGIAF